MIITVPGIPPSVNHYVKHTRRGRHYKTDGARRFASDLAVMARGERVDAKNYSVTVILYMGRKQKGDIDNFAKVVLDSLVSAGVIETDARVQRLEMLKYRDVKNPRTQIEVLAWA